MQPKAIQVFVSYCREDSLWVQEGPHGLIPWLAHVLRRDVQIWLDRKLDRLPGVDYKESIKSEIGRADFALLLISQDFLSSEFIQDYELPWIREQTERKKLGLITILVGPVCDEDLDWLADRQMLPSREVPLIEYTDSNVLWQRVRHEILQAIRNRIRSFRESSAGEDAKRCEAELPPNATASEARTEKPDTLEVPRPQGPSVAETPAEASVPAGKATPEVQSAGTASSSLNSLQPASSAGGGPAVIAPPRVPPTRPEVVAPQNEPPDVLTNSVGMSMKLIPAGDFRMGAGNPGRDASLRPHPVRITRPFFLALTAVTQEQYGRVMGTNPSFFRGAKLPVEQVSWEEAAEFCRSLSALSAERAAGRVYRLPTEAEWEYACRAGCDADWSFGHQASQLTEYAWYGDNARGTTHPVGEKKPNAWGLWDMHGNVWEWCSDWLALCPVQETEDPRGPGAGTYRVIRGGGWYDTARDCRAAYRTGRTPGHRSSDLGFRLACAVNDCRS